jgi:hypothetical protein
MDGVLTGRLAPQNGSGTIPVAASPVERLRFAAERIENSQLRRAILQALDESGGDIERAQKALQQWYDSAMDRVSGWYKRESQTILFWTGLAAAVLLNVNALTIADSLSKNASLRRAIAEQAEHFDAGAAGLGGAGQQGAPAGGGAGGNTQTPNVNTAAPASETASGNQTGSGNEAAPGNGTGLTNSAERAGAEAGPAASAAEDIPADANSHAGTPKAPPGAKGISSTPAAGALADIEKLGLPIGWSLSAQDALLRPVARENGLRILGWLQIALGYLITALAITLGAPFWFDVLNRLMVIRATVKPHEKSQEEGSQDPQDPKKTTPVLLVQGAGGQGAPSGGMPPPVEDNDVFAEPLAPAERPMEGDAAPEPPAPQPATPQDGGES